MERSYTTAPAPSPCSAEKAAGRHPPSRGQPPPARHRSLGAYATPRRSNSARATRMPRR
jgi:hypothetical protein